MQTVYYSTANFIRRTGNVVDLAEYRRRLERASAVRAESLPEALPSQSAAARGRRRESRITPGLFLDCCASAAIVVLTVTVMIQFLVV